MKKENQFRNPRKKQHTGKTSGKRISQRQTIETIDLGQDPTRKHSRRKSGGADPVSMRTTSTKSGRNREFAVITYLFLIIFLVLIGYFIYFQLAKSDEVINSPYNSRANLYAEHVIRGDILSSDGKVLAQTVTDSKGNQSRTYPYENMFAHVVGYVNNGKSGIESQMNFKLLRSHSFFLVQLMNGIREEKNQGDSVVTTLDYRVQKAAYDALGSRDGAVVVLEPKTGKILAMVSKPDFDPNTLEKKWESIVEDEDSSVLLNRATQGLYPPGSTFKIMTVLEYIRENGADNPFHFDCEGEVEVNGEIIHCYNNSVHGEEDLTKAFAKSCNTAFSTIGLDLNLKKFSQLCDEMLFNQELPTSLPTKKSRFSLEKKDGTGKIMQTAIGQGETLVTPLHMAMIAAAVDNDGVVMKPYVVDHIQNDGGFKIKTYRPSEYGSMISKEEAKILQTLMEEVVKSGTGSKLSGQSYDAAGKTGSAEYSNEKGRSHAWFVGYGSKDSYEDIAVAVIVEDGGSGSSTAVPVAKKVFDTYFNTKS